MNDEEEVDILLNAIVDKYGSSDSWQVSWDLGGKGIDPEPAIETALRAKYIVSFRDDWGRTLVITPKGLEKIGRILPGNFFNTW